MTETPKPNLNQKTINKTAKTTSGNNRQTKWKKNFKFRRTCYLTKNNITYIDYKDVELLKRFISKSGQILPRYITGTKCRYQKHLAKAIKRARFLGWLGYISNPDFE